MPLPDQTRARITQAEGMDQPIRVSDLLNRVALAT